DGALPEGGRAGGAAGHRVPVRRPERRAGDRAPERDEPDRPASVAAVVLVRPCDAAGGAEAVGQGHASQFRRGAEDRLAAREGEWPRRAGPMAEGRLEIQVSGGTETGATRRPFFFWNNFRRGSRRMAGRGADPQIRLPLHGIQRLPENLRHARAEATENNALQ